MTPARTDHRTVQNAFCNDFVENDGWKNFYCRSNHWYLIKYIPHLLSAKTPIHAYNYVP